MGDRNVETRAGPPTFLDEGTIALAPPSASRMA